MEDILVSLSIKLTLHLNPQYLLTHDVAGLLGATSQQFAEGKRPDGISVVRPRKPDTKQPRRPATAAQCTQELATQAEADGQWSVAPPRLALPLLTWLCQLPRRTRNRTPIAGNTSLGSLLFALAGR